MNNTEYRWVALLVLGCILVLTVAAPAATLITKYQDQNSSASIQTARMNGQAGIAVVFEGTDDLHYYASSKTAPAPGMELKITAQGEDLSFGNAVFPEYQFYHDPAIGDIEVYVGNFKVFVPIGIVLNDAHREKITVTVTIKGIACTSELCLSPFTKQVSDEVDLSQMSNWPEINFKAAPPREGTTEPDNTVITPAENPVGADAGLSEVLSGWSEAGDSESQAGGSVLWYFLLAIMAGLSINIMPCVLPILPLIIMRLVGQAKESGPKRVALGFSFCGGIVLFFAAFAVISTVINLSTGAALDLNSIYRNPAAVITLFLFILLFALMMMDVLTISLPSSIASKQGNSSGFAGSIGMGVFAGLLSTPCSGAIIGAVLVWAQTQPPAVSAAALILMGVGMALPYAVLVSIPKLLDFVPKPGAWMEIFKKSGGFLLLIIAAKFMLAGLAKEHLINVLLYGVIFAFCVWMWGTWITFSTPKEKKWIVRIIALVIAVTAGRWLLPAPQASQINWQKYDPAVVQNVLKQNKPVLIKFTADWCTNCKVVEKNVYQDPEIAAFLKQQGFITIQADTTQETFQATVDYKSIFKEAGNIPNTVLLNPKSKTIFKLRGIFTQEELIQIIAEQF